MFADVLINHAYSRRKEHFTYEIPNNIELKKGSGVVIPFGKTKKAGLVLNIHSERPKFDTKTIIETISPEVLLQKWQLELVDWIADYYFCSKIDVIKMMLPKHIWRVPKQIRKSMPKEKTSQTQIDHKLTNDQKKIYDSFMAENPKISLIHGITGSGKTELYKKFIQKKVSEGKQCLLLVPEISLTPQFLKYFEGSVPNLAVIHSRISDGKRAEHWRDIHRGKMQLVIGSRSSLFSPFKNLGLIIMDEEHEWSYKQDQTPRYHARSVALKITELTGSNLIFGSATPSIETMWNAKKGDYKLYTLSERIFGTPLPKVHIVDMREELRAGNFSILSAKLEQKIRSTLENKQQVILFLNRRGTASATVCRDCGLALQCKNCDLKLTYHASKFAHATLICHHCGLITKMPNACPNCSSIRIRHFGIGTQKVQTEIEKLFPLARVHRADRDTMNKRDSFKKLHKDLHDHKIDILIGTQMIGKGFDIPKVSLVGVILADIGIHIPDFRAAERNFQLLTQVAGRSGRREKQGEVVIQTYSPDNPSIKLSETHNYDEFYAQEIKDRESTSLPPFGKIIKLIYVDKDKKKCENEALKLKEKIDSTKHEVFAAPALIPRIHNKYHWHILIQGPDPRSLIKKLVQEDLDGWRIDVDPIQVV